MAEKKYDLALVNTKKDKTIQQKPWYKERFRTKYIKSLKPGETSFKNLDGKNWQFIKDGLDDFRDGLPPTTDGQFIIPPISKGIGPTLNQGGEDHVNYVKQQAAARGRFTKDETLFSTLTPLKQQKWDNIEEIQFGLMQHPLALYPHLEECLSAEVFEDVVDLLDPQMNIESDTTSIVENPQPPPKQSKDMGKDKDSECRQSVRQMSPSSRGTEDGEDDARNPYYWLPKRDEAPTGAKKKYLERKEHNKAQERHIQGVTREFCEWVASLGGDTNNIEEATITSLFASGYETKPALSVPIHVVELCNVPMELRISATSQPPAQSKKLPHVQKQRRKHPWAKYDQGRCSHEWMKLEYGAWYLHPSTWKKRPHGVMLRDPKEVMQEELKSEQRKNEKLNQELAENHGTKSFMLFMDRKATRRPEFLDEIGEIQKRNAEEEQRRLEEEHMAKMKRFPSLRVTRVM